MTKAKAKRLKYFFVYFFVFLLSAAFAAVTAIFVGTNRKAKIFETYTGNTFSLPEKRIPQWVKQGDYVTEILIDGKPSQDVVKYDAESRSFTAVGYGTGEIVVINSIDGSLTFTIPFSVSFNSAATLDIISGYDAAILSDGIVSEAELNAITEVSVTDELLNKYRNVDLSDFKDKNLKSVIIKSAAEIYISGLTGIEGLIAGGTRVYVEDGKYSDYLKNNAAFADYVFPVADLKKDSYNVVFELGGGTLAGTSSTERYAETFKSGTSLNLKTGYQPLRAGYTFAGWYTALSGGAKVEELKVAESRKLYAMWNANTYEITFDANGGLPAVSVKEGTFDSKYGNLPQPVRTGYTFKGWKTESGVFVTAETVIKTPSDHTLYAEWQGNEYTLTLKGLEEGDPAFAVLKVTFGSFYGELPAPDDREGYLFFGWYLDGEPLTEDTVVEKAENHACEQIWSGIEHFVTFDAAGGTCGVSGMKVIYNEPFGELPEPEYTGHTFLGWSKTPDGSDYVTAETENFALVDFTLYAIWSKNEYTLKLKLSPDSDSIYKEMSVRTGDKTELPENEYSENEYRVIYAWSLGWDSDSNAGAVGEIVNWQNGFSIDREDGAVIVLYAVWAEIPIFEWLSFSAVDSERTVITGVTDAYTDYSGPLSKYKEQLILPDADKLGKLVVAIADGAFCGVSELRTVEIPKGVANIGAQAFSNCTNLTAVTFADGGAELTIGEKAFSGCGYSFKSVIGGSNVVAVGEGAFRETYWINGATSDHTWADTNGLLILGKVVMRYSSSAGGKLKEENFPKTVNKIASYAFSEIKPASGSYIMIPDRITEVGAYAFKDSAFESVYVLSSKTAFGKGAFDGVKEFGYLSLASTANLAGVFGDAVSVRTLSVAASSDISVIFKQADVKISTLRFEAAAVNVKNSVKNISADSITFSKSVLSYVKLSGFKSVGTIDLKGKSLSNAQGGENIAINGFPVKILDLCKNSISYFNLTEVYASQILLAANQVEKLVCTKANEFLKWLHVPSEGDNKVGDLDFVTNLPNLTSLDVANNKLSSLGNLANLTNLTELYLGGNPVLGSSAEMNKINNTEFCSKLVRLNLGGVTGNVDRILDIVTKCRALEWLQIYGIGASSAQLTARITKTTNPNLTYIKVTHNGFTVAPKFTGFGSELQVVIDYNVKN